jgi:hypothetical protein
MVEAVRLFGALQGINMYVPGMGYSAGMVHSQPTAFSLGSPAAADNDIIDTDIDADGVAGTVTTQSWTADSPYGRTVTMNMNADPGALLGVYDVHGFDYLGQPMVERFTHVNGSTPVIYGKKAFYRITKVVNITAASNATTVDLGTGFRLGLPYKGDVAWAKEGGVLVPLYKRNFNVAQDWSDADTTAGGSKYIRSPCPGYITALWGIMGSGGSTTNAATTVELATVAITGLTITLDQDGDFGVIVTDAPTTAGYNANNRFIADGTIEIVHAATTAGGQMTVGITIAPMQFVLPVLTDPGTAITGDPRGTYESLAVFDGATEVVVGLLGDNSANASGNGGLHGIQHYYA